MFSSGHNNSNLQLHMTPCCIFINTMHYFASDSGFLRTLDSSIKRNTAVIKKLKQINEEQKEGIMDELRSVNLSKFVSEAVTAICDAKLKSSDIQAAVQVGVNLFILSE